jgi:poly(hydroxyalkanoate) depolymerase family esterase
MAKRLRSPSWAKLYQRSFAALTRSTVKASTRALGRAIQPALDKRKPPKGAGDWIAGMVLGASGSRRYRLYRPPDVQFGERLPLLVMLHGCGQDAKSFALSTRMNRIAARERFLVLYPEQDRLAHAQGCWNWYDTQSGRAFSEAALLLRAVDQVCLLYSADRNRVALAGLSAGASMAALLATRYPERFKAVVMHSGIPPGTAQSGMSVLGAMQGLRATRSPAPATPVAAWPPLMVIHGGVDRIVVASNGEAAAKLWAGAAGAHATAQRTVQRGQRYAMDITDFRRGRSTVATLVEVGQLGHAWSGGAPTQPHSDVQGPDASRMVWAFAARQFKSQAAA